MGGNGEIGKNMQVYEYGDDILIVDCGVMFPRAEMLGIDLIIPNVSYLEERKNKIRGMVFTHGHEDHIGALPYHYEALGRPPVFASKLTKAFVENKFKETDAAVSAPTATTFGLVFPSSAKPSPKPILVALLPYVSTIC